MSNKSKTNSTNKVLVVVIIVAVFLAICGIAFAALPSGRDTDSTTASDSNIEQNEQTAQDAETEVPESDTKGESTMSGKVNAQIEIENYGTISVELDADAAPITVANFVKLANEGFYDGLTFHRIMEGFMMQGGDPDGNGTGGSDENIKGEFASNGVDNPLSHTRGAISMARSQMPDSASSQFFICHEDATFLDGNYACFGYVTDGMDVVDAVCTDSNPIDDNGTIPAEAQPKIVSVTILD